ncbi:MAG: hypothetical protein JNK73_04320 [Bacteroidia bacterium]|nr:hypothetical protein [Bacteroidia bacterium]
MTTAQKTLRKCLFVLATAFIVACGSEGEEEKEDLLPVTQSDTLEDVLDLGMHPMGSDTAENYIDSTNLLLSINSTQSLNLRLEQIDSAALAGFRWRSNTLHKAHNHTQHYVSAVQIWFSLNNQTIRCLYEPLSLCSADTGKTKTYTVSNSNTYYLYRNDSFVVAGTNDLGKITAYQQNIKFRENPQSTHYRDFVVDPSDAGDITSVIYTFQEFDSVMVSNKAQRLSLWNYAYRKNTTAGVRSRHSILLAPDSFALNNLHNPKSIRLPFKGRFANLANPCPPSCASVSFQTY